jgi:hypothetical protein
MAVRADNLALVHLFQHDFERDSAVRDGTDVEPLVAQVIELEDDRIGLAAVNARVLHQVEGDPASVLVL